MSNRILLSDALVVVDGSNGTFLFDQRLVGNTIVVGIVKGILGYAVGVIVESAVVARDLQMTMRENSFVTDIVTY